MICLLVFAQLIIALKKGIGKLIDFDGGLKGEVLFLHKTQNSFVLYGR